MDRMRSNEAVMYEATRAVRAKLERGEGEVSAVFGVATSLRLTQAQRRRLSRQFGLGV